MYNNYKVSPELQSMINNERIVWAGRPKKSCFILECVFNPMLVFALIWAIIDFSFIGNIFAFESAGFGNVGTFLIAFFALHLMPVWIYLGGVLFAFRKLKNTEYAITERGIYITSGCFAKQYNFKPFTDLSHVYIHRGILDQMLGVGDVISQCHHYGYSHSDSHNSHSSGFNITDIPDYVEVCNLIKKYQTDIYADTQFPNDFRPQSNHGYNTNYYPNDGRNSNNYYSQQTPNNNYYNNSQNQNFNNQYNNQYTNQYNNYNRQNYNSDYNSNPNFTGEKCDTHDGYEVNGGSNNRDSWEQ